MFKTFDGVKSATQLSTIPKCGGERRWWSLKNFESSVDFSPGQS